MNDLDDVLSGALRQLADRAPHDPDLATTIRRRVRRRRLVLASAAAVATSAVAVTGVVALPDGGLRGSPAASSGTVTAAPSCSAPGTRALLPEWARGGFSDPEPVMPFVLSSSGNVVAILFGDTLTSPPRPDVANKVLWVWRNPPLISTQARMTARLDGTGRPVTAGLPSPVGPSYVDLPAPGCWHVTLTWPGGSDTLKLSVVSPGS